MGVHMQLDGIRVKIVDERAISALKIRKDVKHATWFRCDNDILEQEAFFDFTHEEILVWIYIQCRASSEGTIEPFINFERAERFAKLEKSTILSAILKLERKHILPVDVPDTLRARNEDVTCTSRPRYVTKRTKRTKNTGEDRTSDKALAFPDLAPPSSSGYSTDQLLEDWASICKDLPQIKRMSEKRRRMIAAQLRSYPDREHWVEVMSKWASLQWLKTKWRPGLDVLLNEHKRILTLEGQYDDWKPKGEGDLAADAARVLEAIERIPPDHWLRDAPIMLGQDLFDRLREKKINVSNLRLEPRNEFTVKRLIQRLSGELQAKGG